jgi:hypothetical protein
VGGGGDRPGDRLLADRTKVPHPQAVLWKNLVQLPEADTGLNRYPLTLDIHGNDAIELVEVDQGVVGENER